MTRSLRTSSNTCKRPMTFSRTTKKGRCSTGLAITRTISIPIRHLEQEPRAAEQERADLISQVSIFQVPREHKVDRAFVIYFRTSLAVEAVRRGLNLNRRGHYLRKAVISRYL